MLISSSLCELNHCRGTLIDRVNVDNIERNRGFRIALKEGSKIMKWHTHQSLRLGSQLYSGVRRFVEKCCLRAWRGFFLRRFPIVQCCKHVDNIEQAIYARKERNCADNIERGRSFKKTPAQATTAKRGPEQVTHGRKQSRTRAKRTNRNSRQWSNMRQ